MSARLRWSAPVHPGSAPPVVGLYFRGGQNIDPAWLRGRRLLLDRVERIEHSDVLIVRTMAGRRVVEEAIEVWDAVSLAGAA